MSGCKLCIFKLFEYFLELSNCCWNWKCNVCKTLTHKSYTIKEYSIQHTHQKSHSLESTFSPLVSRWSPSDFRTLEGPTSCSHPAIPKEKVFLHWSLSFWLTVHLQFRLRKIWTNKCWIIQIKMGFNRHLLTLLQNSSSFFLLY